MFSSVRLLKSESQFFSLSEKKKPPGLKLAQHLVNSPFMARCASVVWSFRRFFSRSQVGAQIVRCVKQQGQLAPFHPLAKSGPGFCRQQYPPRGSGVAWQPGTQMQAIGNHAAIDGRR
jgi:hypothetical protein